MKVDYDKLLALIPEKLTFNKNQLRFSEQDNGKQRKEIIRKESHENALNFSNFHQRKVSKLDALEKEDLPDCRIHDAE